MSDVRTTPLAEVTVPMIEAACESLLESTGHDVGGDEMRAALQRAFAQSESTESTGATPRTDRQVIYEGNISGGVVVAEFARELERLAKRWQQIADQRAIEVADLKGRQWRCGEMTFLEWWQSFSYRRPDLTDRWIAEQAWNAAIGSLPEAASITWLEDELIAIMQTVAPGMGSPMPDEITYAIMVTAIRRMMEADTDKYEALLERWQKRQRPQKLAE